MFFVFEGIEPTKVSNQMKWKEGGYPNISIEGLYETGFIKYASTLFELRKEDKVNRPILIEEFPQIIYSQIPIEEGEEDKS